jgi:hypothetical protein
LLWLILVSRPVRQALALDASESNSRPFPSGITKAGTVVVAELKFRHIALQALLTAKGLCAAHAEYAEEVFDVVSCDASGVDIFARAVV